MNSEILILDDHPTYQRLLKSAAEARGFQIAGFAPNSNAALQLCSRANPAVVVLDLHLEDGTDGYSFCQLLREILGDVTIVATSSFVGRDSVDRAFRAGADRCLRKPFRMEEALRLFENLAVEHSGEPV